MTDYGLEIRNADNIVIIDSKFKNHTYHSHGRTFVNQYLTEIDIDDISTSGMLFIKAPSFYVFPMGFVKNGSIYDKIVIASDSTGYVDWVVYEEFEHLGADEFGLNVYDSSSNIVFSSDSKGYINIVDEFSYTFVGSNLTVNNADDNYFAFMGSDIGYEYDLMTTPTLLKRGMRGFKKVNSTTLTTGMFYYYYSEGELPSGSSAAGGNTSFTPKWFIEIEPPPSL
jgi:hypothetical protein